MFRPTGAGAVLGLTAPNLLLHWPVLNRICMAVEGLKGTLAALGSTAPIKVEAICAHCYAYIIYLDPKRVYFRLAGKFGAESSTPHLICCVVFLNLA